MYDGVCSGIRGSGFLWPIPVVLVFLIGLSMIMIAKNNRQKKRPIESSSLEILNEIYARGEIDDQEYSRRKKILEIGRASCRERV